MLLAIRPLGGKAGAKMFWCVVGFSVSTIVFGLSRNMVLSMIALIFVGATDMVSVVIRGILIQLATPNEMRGRVTAVDMIFIGTSNELGGFESGVTAQKFGTVAAVVIGGVGSLVVTAICAALFPQLRNADQLPTTETQAKVPAPLG
jgi:MFS family permease